MIIATVRQTAETALLALTENALRSDQVQKSALAQAFADSAVGPIAP